MIGSITLFITGAICGAILLDYIKLRADKWCKYLEDKQVKKASQHKSIKKLAKVKTGYLEQ